MEENILTAVSSVLVLGITVNPYRQDVKLESSYCHRDDLEKYNYKLKSSEAVQPLLRSNYHTDTLTHCPIFPHYHYTCLVRRLHRKDKIYLFKVTLLIMISKLLSGSIV